MIPDIVVTEVVVIWVLKVRGQTFHHFLINKESRTKKKEK